VALDYRHRLFSCYPIELHRLKSIRLEGYLVLMWQKATVAPKSKRVRSALDPGWLVGMAHRKRTAMSSSASDKVVVWAFRTSNMRTLPRYLAILTLATLLAPSVRWTSPQASADACGCPPGACMCPAHQHSSGRLPACCLGTGGRCGIQSPASYIATILSTLTYVPTEHPWWNPIAAWSLRDDASGLSLLPSHARIPDQPPRASL